MLMVMPLQAYELKLAPHPAPFSILKFTGVDRISQLYRYEIEFTSPMAGIPMDQVIGRPARFVIAPIDPNIANLRRMYGENAGKYSTIPPVHTIHGIVTKFDECETSADETRYRVLVEPKLADLDRGVTSRLFQKQSVEEIVTDTLRHYGYRAGVDFVFNLRGKYQRHEYITQYHETTFAFIQRICAQEGIWFRWEQKKDYAVIVFGDDLDAYARKPRVVPHRRDSGLESVGADSIRTLRRRTKRVAESVRLHDYNHRQADVSLLVEQNAAKGDTTTDAVDYHWGEHYKTPEEGSNLALLRHQAHLAKQITFIGTGNPFWLEAGEVMQVDPFRVDAKHGIFITSVRSHGARNASYRVTFEGIPSDRVWRTSMDTIRRPTIAGILPARITSPGDYRYAYLTEEGWYVIKLPFDLDEWSPGGTSRPVRFAKPYSGDNYGHHFPLIDSAEVALEFTAGDPNRPIIIGAMHDSLHPDLVTNLNNTRNLIRTAAQNELRMEDKEGGEHIHLTTPFQTSELNLGHMVDGERKERGRGAELRTDERVAVRGAKGVLVTAEAQLAATGQQLAMQEADMTLDQAHEILRALNDSANAAKALQADIDQQRALIEQKLKGLQKPAILATAPEGVGLLSGAQMQFAARKQMFITAGDGLDIGVMKRIAVAAGEAISFFAVRLGIRIFAAKGKVQVQAQSDTMELMSMQDLTASSSDGEVIITGRKGVTIGDGSGAYIKLSGGKIILGSPAGEIELKGDLKVDAPDGGSFKFPTWSKTPLNEVKDATSFGFSE
ncbi:type VI secretion system tip protein VgrG [Paraburkholderia sp. MMS20-SJTR3]|uniref:Type VI secretion system tip protein VgrG n=1 Tax=Paraburkholderia sejongensis TaxID=2886946 RepID=A0ABS8JRB7_9BURK|nr:type VI secretion system Vgr family protein [Paraburkholderia sp. MMS20-SJTR3]MCC8392451.1 type VI secretion system tip protein VgrG [Paraburkholderia sp. MMS20-SJTR3]